MRCPDRLCGPKRRRIGAAEAGRTGDTDVSDVFLRRGFGAAFHQPWSGLCDKRIGSIIFLMGLASNVLGYRHPAAILDRSKNKCCGLITDGEELKNNQLCFSVDTTVLHLFSDLSRTCPRTSGGWIPPLALTPKNNRSVSFLVA